MSDQYFYLTTTLPYVNAAPHIGFAMEIIAADIIARSQKIMGKQVIFNTGTDEHGQKIYQKALENQLTPQEYVDMFAAKFDDLKNLLNLSYTHFVRTTAPHHQQAAQEFWKRCDHNGYIYKQLYQVKYCVGCELEKTDSELVNGRCPLHPNKELEIREEENYFFRFSAFQQPLLDFYEAYPDFVKPAGKQTEITSFVKQGLQDFSISRLKEKMPWGIPVPGDDQHVMYVWFDALVNYISTLGWPNETPEFSHYWPGVQLCGKDNLRQQAAMWQAMLMAAGLPNSSHILVNGFINVDGQKMSKSLGNVIAPTELVERYGVDGTRYLLVTQGTFGDDIDVTWEKLDTLYTAHLANGLGNLCSRVAKLCDKNQLQLSLSSPTQFDPAFQQHLDQFELTLALNWIFELIAAEDKRLAQTKPWEKTGQNQQRILTESVQTILHIAYHLQPFLPETSQFLLDHFTQKKITALKPLFPRIA